jgi:hypothetical protein
LQVIVVPMADTITAKFLESFADKVVNHIRGVPSLAIVPLRISLVWYVSDRAWTSMQLKQYWPRICISNRANDWMTSIETIIVSLIASGLGTWIDAQQEELSKTHKDVDVLWFGHWSTGYS